jgi:hypothetical protein
MFHNFDVVQPCYDLIHPIVFLQPLVVSAWSRFQNRGSARSLIRGMNILAVGSRLSSLL